MRKALSWISVLLAGLSLVACGSGGGSSGSGSPAPPAATPTPRIDVLPASFDFGRVTSGNLSAPLEVTIRNTGTGSLSVTSIALASGSSPAFLPPVFTGGTRPCGSAAPTIAAGDSCTFRVAFQPTSGGTFTGNLQIASGDSRSPVVSVPMSGTSETLTSLAVRVNQVDTACPGNAATAYVSVTDQTGFPVTGLNRGNFTLTEGTPPSPDLLLGAVALDAAYKPLAIAAVVDNSKSVSQQPVVFSDMKNGLTALLGQMRANDVGEFIAFGSVFVVREPFPSPSSITNPSNKDALLAAAGVPWTGETNTLLYDTLYRAISDTALQTPYRRAVIVATDGIDQGPAGPLSTRTLEDVINLAVSSRVPVFTVGFGGSINETPLLDLARRTGGVFYRASTSQNLATIFQQLSSLLFQNQYLLTFNQLSLGAAGTSAPLRVNVVAPNGITGSGTSSIVSCN